MRQSVAAAPAQQYLQYTVSKSQATDIFFECRHMQSIRDRIPVPTVMQLILQVGASPRLFGNDAVGRF